MATNQGNGGRSNRGFAAMNDQQQREIASKGGKASASEQRRDSQGQFSGTSGRSGGSAKGGQSGGQSTRGNRNQPRDSQGQFTSSRSGSGSSQGGGNNR
jgi:general stress protein YciG